MNKLMKISVLAILVFVLSGSATYAFCTKLNSILAEEEQSSATACRVVRKSLKFKNARIVNDTNNIINYSYMDSDKYIVTLIDDYGEEYNIGSEKYYNIFLRNLQDRNNIQADILIYNSSDKCNKRITNISNVEETGYNE